MTPLLAQLLVAVAAAFVITLPGGLVLAWLGVDRVLVPALRPPAALAATLALCLPGLIAMLRLELPIVWLAAWLALVTALGAVLGVRSALRAGPRTDVSRTAAAWLAAHSWPGWIAALTWPLRLVLAWAAAVAFVFGGWLDDGDMLYHASVARKLVELDEPGFATIQLFVDGSLHPGYAAPVWHALWAVTASVTGADVLTVLWMVATAAAGCTVLAAAGLAQVALRSETAAWMGGVLFILVNGLARPPLYGVLPGAAAPGPLTVELLLSLALALWLVALWDVQQRARRRAFGLLVLAVVPAVLAVHVSYIAFLGLALAGYLLVWAVRLPWPRAIVRRHALSAAGVLFVTLAGLAVLAPVLSQLSTIGAATNADAAAAEYSNWHQIMVGARESHHLRPDLLARYGGLALIGVCCLPLGLLRRREPVGWLLVGSGIVVLGVSLTDALFMPFEDLASISQTKRLAFALPYELALTLAVLLAARAAGRGLLAPRVSRRMATAVAVAVVAVAAAFVVHSIPPIAALKAGGRVPEWPVMLTFAILLAGGVGMIVELVRRLRQRQSSPVPSAAEPVVQLTGRPMLAVAGALLAAVAAPLAQPFASDVRAAAAQRPATALDAYDVAQLDRPVVRAVRQLPAGSVVAAPPGIALRIAAVAPVYVVAVPGRHVAGTPANRRDERLEQAAQLYGLRSTPRQRVQALEALRADLVLLEAPRGSARRQVVRDIEAAGWCRTGRSRGLLFYRDCAVLR